ncbi:DUF2271 domain-containing protein [Rhodovulum sulfidophilum]|uniref:DUF2271 domain-containing protein n=1 Tax=Rhodovulum sulfidophilum TaxID=35806 RepID=UPI000951C23F|nr:DUF2271 domain-containing protein [Rhodovulum sulfidophilum]OLS53826.1 hypothetical protein BV392_18770 [Rhodovulum sulfidophilum]
MADYGGDGAYLAYSVTDASGAYAGSLWVAWVKAKYYKSLSGWCAATGGDSAEVEGISDASVGACRTLTVRLDLAEALFDAGYELHNAAAVEDMRDSLSEIVLPLGTEGLSRPVAGEAISPASPAKCEVSASLTMVLAVPVAGVEAEMSVRSPPGGAAARPTWPRSARRLPRGGARRMSCWSSIPRTGERASMGRLRSIFAVSPRAWRRPSGRSGARLRGRKRASGA